MDKRFLSILAIIIVLFVGIFAFSQHKNNSGGNGSSSNAQPSNHVQGENAKNVTLLEYGDYQCPVCYSYYPIVKQVAADNAANIHFQFRNLPLVSVHKNAFAGSRAAEAAALQGKFWEMHDKLYDNQDPTGQSGWVASNNPLSFFEDFAKEIGLDLTKFGSDYSSSQVNGTINADLDAFQKTGQSLATPTFFINGVYIDNSKLTDSSHQPVAAKFQEQLDAAMKKSQ